ncbi:MAG: acyl-CoA dehydratase activase-related protein [Bacilli bacterium]
MKTTIGIPRALLYYEYGEFWCSFFDNLDISYILSPITNKKIIARGTHLMNDEACLSLKIFIGHVDYLKDKCEYILVPRIGSIEKTGVVCTNFNALYDITSNIFKKQKLLDYNLDIKNNKNEYSEFMNIAQTLGISYSKAKKAYVNAKRTVREKKQKQYAIRSLSFSSTRKKILLVGHSYNLKEEFIGGFLIDFLNNEGLEVILSTNNTKNKKLYKKLMPTMYFSYNKIYVNSLINDIKKVDGIILISAFPCGNDSLVNEMILRKVKNIPIINIIFDELSENAGLITRLESFCDILKNEENK